jgi:phosphatidate cytidylyltransferase
MWLLTALILSPIAIASDLFESVLKRKSGVKDSGSLLPGHGGILDRFDAVFFTAPIYFFLLKTWNYLIL